MIFASVDSRQSFAGPVEKAALNFRMQLPLFLSAAASECSRSAPFRVYSRDIQMAVINTNIGAMKAANAGNAAAKA
ncbi:hypothetical protein, partial [Pseudomonas sp.]|uniref:hypothetical protein n=1 Tax=Pseudomonas sp. TaxID=306 RepID=UPI0025D8A3FF